MESQTDLSLYDKFYQHMGRKNLYRKETVDQITTKQHFLPKLYTSFEKNQQENQFSETFSH